MDDPLVFLTPFRVPKCSVRFDKQVVGYHLQHMMGRIEVGYDGQLFHLEGEWIWPAYPGPAIHFAPVDGEPWFHRHIGFQGTRVNQWRESGLWPAEPQPAPAGRDWAAAFDEAIELARRPDRYARLRGSNLVEGMLLQLAESRGQRLSEQSSLLERVLERIGHEGFSPDYDALARDLGYSFTTLRRRFKVETGGLALHEYVLLLRIGEAQELLRTTTLPLGGIADQLGYSSEAFFSRQFRERVGMTPGEYRRQVLD